MKTNTQIGMVDKNNLHEERDGSDVDLNVEQSLVAPMVGKEKEMDIAGNKISTVGPVEETVKPKVVRVNEDLGLNLEPLW